MIYNFEGHVIAQQMELSIVGTVHPPSEFLITLVESEVCFREVCSIVTKQQLVTGEMFHSKSNFRIHQCILSTVNGKGHKQYFFEWWLEDLKGEPQKSTRYTSNTCLFRLGV